MSVRVIVGLAGVSRKIILHGEPVAGQALAELVDAGGVGAGRKLTGRHAQIRQQVLQQVVGAAVDRPREQHGAAQRHQGQQRGRNGGHARRKDGARLGVVPQVEPVLEDLQIRVVEPAVDQPHGPLGVVRLEAVGVGEELLALLGAAEGEGRSQKNGRLDRPLRQLGAVAPTHHQRLGSAAAGGRPIRFRSSRPPLGDRQQDPGVSVPSRPVAAPELIGWRASHPRGWRASAGLRARRRRSAPQIDPAAR